MNPFSGDIFNGQQTSKTPLCSIVSGQVEPSPLLCYAIRLTPGSKVRQSLMEFVRKKQLGAAFVVSGAGNVRNVKLRLVGTVGEENNYVLDLVEPMEVVSLAGTLSGGAYLNCSLADQTGRVVGGNVIEMDVFHSLELIIGDLATLMFSRGKGPTADQDLLCVDEKFVS